MFKILIKANKGEKFLASGHGGWKITSKRVLGKKIKKEILHILLKMDENLVKII